MPWTPKDAKAKTHKANTPKKQRQWSDVADSVLAKTGNEGRAIREANAVVGKARRGSSKSGLTVQLNKIPGLTEAHSYDWRSRSNLKRGSTTKS